MDGTIIQQGKFTSTGVAKLLNIRSDVDWMKVINYTETNTVTGSRGVEYFWQRGLAANDGFVKIRNAGGTAIDARTSAGLAVPGFTLIDTTDNAPGALVAITSISAANPPVVTVASTATLNTGDVVRIINDTGAQQLGGIDFTITVLNGTTFSLTYMAQIVAGTTGFYRKINYDPFFYPRRRIITAITRGATTAVKMAVTTTFTVGQKVFFNVPSTSGTVELNGQYGTILAINTATNTLTVDIDSSAYTAFTFPLTTGVPFTPAQVVPGGEDTAEALALGVDILGDATENRAILGMKLGAGITSPAGSSNDVIYWIAGKSFSVDNQ